MMNHETKTNVREIEETFSNDRGRCVGESSYRVFRNDSSFLIRIDSQLNPSMTGIPNSDD